MGKVVKGNFPRRQDERDVRTSESGPVPIYQFRMSVSFSDPLIWRTVRVSGDMTLGRFHRIIQACMGWRDYDSHQFLVGKIFYQSGFGIDGMEKKVKFDEARYRLHELEEGMRFIFSYLYDGGDGWELQIDLEEADASGVRLEYPILIAGEKGCPPEDIGDIHRYQALVAECERESGQEVSVRLADYPDFNPELLDIEKINEILKKI